MGRPKGDEHRARESMSDEAQPPAVTVVIPVWDEPYTEYVKRALASVRAQSPATPIIVVDNASVAALPPLEEARLIRAPRRLTTGAARNLGLEHVETEYVMFLDADDELIEGALIAVHEQIDRDPTVSVAAMSLLEADTGKRHRNPRRFVPALARFPTLFALATSVWSLYSTQACAVCRTAWVRACGGYADLSCSQDWVLAVSQAFRGRVVVDLRPGCVYARHAGSLTGGGLDAGQLLSSARLVRHRLASDPAVPAWTRRLIPVVAILQTMLIAVVRPGYLSLRAFAATRRTRPQATSARGDLSAIHNGRHT